MTIPNENPKINEFINCDLPPASEDMAQRKRGLCLHMKPNKHLQETCPISGSPEIQEWIFYGCFTKESPGLGRRNPQESKHVWELHGSTVIQISALDVEMKTRGLALAEMT